MAYRLMRKWVDRSRAIVVARSYSMDSRGLFRKRSQRIPSCSDRELISRARTDALRADPAGPTLSQASSRFLGRKPPMIRLTLNLN
jgi:hypothetical protein